MKGRGKRSNKISLTIKKRGLILCEGETEANYFKGLISQQKNRRKFSSISVDIYKPKDHSPVGLINNAKGRVAKAKQERNKYDFIWVIFDKDGHADIPKAFELARTAVPPINIAFTIPCFEFFILLHFLRTTKPFKKCDDVIGLLKDYVPSYEKASNIFEVLLATMENGLRNSRWLAEQKEKDLIEGQKIYDHSAYSNVHELIDYLHFNLNK